MTDKLETTGELDNSEYIIKIPKFFNFGGEIIDFDPLLKIFDWNISPKKVTIDFTECAVANYESLTLMCLYMFHLKTTGSFVQIKTGKSGRGKRKKDHIKRMWRLLGGEDWSKVLMGEVENFESHAYKPMISIKDEDDLRLSMLRFDSFSKDFNIDYKALLQNVLSEVIFNTLDHGHSFVRYEDQDIRIPSLLQTSWYQQTNHLSLLVADTGIGIRRHLSNYINGLASDEEAILKSLEPKVSGAFGQRGYSSGRENAGYGLYMTSNIIKKLKADMYVVSGNGLVHISPRDKTHKTLSYSWPGTFIYLRVAVNSEDHISKENILQEIRQAAQEEIRIREGQESDKSAYFRIENHFGANAENKYAARNFRITKIMPAVKDGLIITLDFKDVESAPHSFINALLKEVVQEVGYSIIKRVKFVNTQSSIRETIDQVISENVT